MPENARMGNNLFDRRNSKCKRMQEPQYYQMRNIVYKTCNNCRFKAYQRTHPLNTLADFNGRGYRSVDVSAFLDTETDSEEYVSSSAAASTRDKPEPEPEPSPDGGIWMIVTKQMNEGGIRKFLNQNV